MGKPGEQAFHLAFCKGRFRRYRWKSHLSVEVLYEPQRAEPTWANTEAGPTSARVLQPLARGGGVKGASWLRTAETQRCCYVEMMGFSL